MKRVLLITRPLLLVTVAGLLITGCFGRTAKQSRFEMLQLGASARAEAIAKSDLSPDAKERALVKVEDTLLQLNNQLMIREAAKGDHWYDGVLEVISIAGIWVAANTK